MLTAFDDVYDQLKDLNYKITYYREAGLGIEAFRFARRFDNLVEASKIKDTEQETIDQLVEKLKSSASSFFADYQPEIDEAVFVALISEFGTKINASDQPGELRAMLKKAGGNYSELAADIFNDSYFTSEEEMMKLFDGYKKSQYKKIEKDPVFSLTKGLAVIYNTSLLPLKKS